MTNRTGRWVSEGIDTAAEDDIRDLEPVIAVGASGEIVVAYRRSRCMPFWCTAAEIRVVRSTGSGWSDPEIVGPGMSPTMAVEGGSVHLAFLATAAIDDIGCHPAVPIGYASDTSGQWIIETIADDGYWPQIDVGSDGSTSILFSNWCPPLNRAGLQVVARAAVSDGFTYESIPETEAGTAYSWATALDDAGRLHVLYGHDDPVTGEMKSLYVHSDGPSWTSALQPIEGQEPMSMAVASDGATHVLAVGRDGTWYATNATGSFISERVSSLISTNGGQAAIAIDEAGRVHLVFEAVTGDELQLWYGVR